MYQTTTKATKFGVEGYHL